MCRCYNSHEQGIHAITTRENYGSRKKETDGRKKENYNVRSFKGTLSPQLSKVYAKFIIWAFLCQKCAIKQSHEHPQKVMRTSGIDFHPNMP